MADDFLDSSDSVRSGRTLRHAKRVTFRRPLELELGGRLEELTVAYETYGRLNADRSNAVLVCHALSGDSHVARHGPKDDPGWWDVAVGPGKPIDTRKYFVICPNILGGCRGTTGPDSVNPRTGRPYGRDFPTITIGDMVEAQRRLADHLGVRRLLAAVGGSMGGMQVLGWAARHPSRLRGAIPVATAARLTSQALAFDVVGRNAILRDPRFHDGAYAAHNEAPDVGLAIARMIGHITYLSPESMQRKFDVDRLSPRDVATAFEKKFSVGSYLGYQGSKFVERFDANSYVALSMAMDLFDLGGEPQELRRTVARSRCRWLVVSFSSDWLFPPSQSRDLVQALLAAGRPVSYCNVASGCGHDAFLLADDVDRYGGLISGFLEELSGSRPAALAADEATYGDDPRSIFHARRLDYDLLEDLIPHGGSVLDLGCGEGTLLARLRARGDGPLLGVELEERKIVACVRRGLDVIHADLNEGLPQFRPGQFDTVVLSQTLQAIRDVEGIVEAMLEVGKRCIVSFPNFAHRSLRRMLQERGRAPVSPGLPFRWYESPNIRFFSIDDFRDFCAGHGIRVHRVVALDSERKRLVTDEPNLNADTAIFVLSRPGRGAGRRRAAKPSAPVRTRRGPGRSRPAR